MDKKYKGAGSQCITETKAAEPHLPQVTPKENLTVLFFSTLLHYYTNYHAPTTIV
jgi:peptidase E